MTGRVLLLPLIVLALWLSPSAWSIESRSVTLVDVQGNTRVVLDHGSGGVVARYVYSASGRDFTAVDVEGNTVGLFNATTGVVHSRLWYTPSGEVRTAEFTGLLGGVGFDLDAFFDATDFRYLYGQGRYLGGAVIANSEYHGGITLRADGGQYDALLNGLVALDAQAWSDDVEGVVYEDITWWDRYGDTVSAITHVVLDIGGLIPVYGIGFDLANAGLYHLEGDTFNRNLSLGAAVPGAGYAAIGIKYGRLSYKALRAGNTAVEVAGGARRLYNASRTVDVGYNVGQSGYFTAQGYAAGDPVTAGLGLAGVGINARAVGRGWSSLSPAQRRFALQGLAGGTFLLAANDAEAALPDSVRRTLALLNDLNAQGATVVRRHRAGNLQVIHRGRHLHLPAGHSLSRTPLPVADEFGDALQDAVRAARARFGVDALTPNEVAAIARARNAAAQTGAWWRPHLLYRQAQGRHVQNAVGDQFGLDIARRGIDIPRSPLSYEILSGTRSNIDLHARRMPNVYFRFVTFTP